MIFKCARCKEEFILEGDIPELEEDEVLICDECLEQLQYKGTVH